MDTISARDATTQKYPSQQKRKPYMSPAGPPSVKPYTNTVKRPSQVIMMVQLKPNMDMNPKLRCALISKMSLLSRYGTYSQLLTLA